VTEQTTGKGRPTPKRSDAQKRKGGPVTTPSTNRREAAKQLRAKQAEDRKRVRQGSLRGDESALLKRDQGPVRRLVRELVDARRSMAWLLLPIAAVVVVSGFFRSVQVQALGFALFLAALCGAAVEMAFTARDLRKALKNAFPEEKTRGHIVYGLMRSTQARRLRVPRPNVRP
jgi:hypothetical protein